MQTENKGLMGIPLDISAKNEDPGTSPMGAKQPQDQHSGAGAEPVSPYDIQAPESRLSGGTWERFAPGQFAYHPSEQDLAMPDLIEHFAQIEVVGDLLIMPDGSMHEGQIAHDVDADGVEDKPTHPEPQAPAGSPGGDTEPDGDEGPSPDPTSKIGVPPGNSWMDKPGPSIMPPNPTKHY